VGYRPVLDLREYISRTVTRTAERCSDSERVETAAITSAIHSSRLFHTERNRAVLKHRARRRNEFRTRLYWLSGPHAEFGSKRLAAYLKQTILGFCTSPLAIFEDLQTAKQPLGPVFRGALSVFAGFYDANHWLVSAAARPTTLCWILSSLASRIVPREGPC
jgi:hypothetical protein